MFLPLVYLDQNIVSMQSTGKIDFSNVKDVQWAYSKEHFEEIRRACNTKPFLDALDQLSAALIDLKLVAGKPTGEAILTPGVPAEECFQEYIEATNEVDFSLDSFHPLISWACGGQCAEELSKLPGQFAYQLDALFGRLPQSITRQLTSAPGEAFYELLTPAISSMLEWDNNIKSTRSFFGFEKTGVSNIGGDNPLRRIWESISPKIPQLSVEQFYGFAPLGDEQQPPTTWEGIVACCTVLDVLGFHAEKKVRKLSKVPNVLSDARHIAYGAYCSGIIAGDKRMANRAKAIYEFQGITSTAMVLCTNPET